MNTVFHDFVGMSWDPGYLAIQILVFLTVTLLAAAVMLLLSRLRALLSRRLSRHLPGKTDARRTKEDVLEQQDSAGPAVRTFYRLFKIVVPADEAREKKVRLKLVRAGFRSRRAYQNYAAAKVVLGLLPPVFYWLWLLYTRLTPGGLMLGLGLGLCGFFLPNILLLYLAQKRQERILRATPDALDLMVICVEAGLGLDMALKKVGAEIRFLCQDLSDEFHLTNLEINAGKGREESLKKLGVRTGVAEVQNLMTLLVQTNRFGTSLGQTLRVHADAMRAKRRQKAEERAAKAAVKLLIPLIFFIFPAMFVVILGPAWIRIVKNLLPVAGGG